jgi:hypothetical protein
LANFVGCVVGFLNVSVLIRLRSLLLAAALSFEIEWYKLLTLINSRKGGFKWLKIKTLNIYLSRVQLPLSELPAIRAK